MPRSGLSKGDVRESLEPRLRLFLSADIVGSTAFKQRSGEGSEQWFRLVRSFYMMAERYLAFRWSLAKDRYQDAERPLLFGEDAPELWKTVGDEVLFTKDIAHPSEATMCMSIWLQVLEDLRQLLDKSDLDVKSSAWLADFPIRNREIFLRTGSPAKADDGERDGPPAQNEIIDTANDPTEDLDWANDNLFKSFKARSPGVTRDFIGQSIDTGFRVSTAASSRKLMLSVELAHMLSMECERLDLDPYRIGAFPVRSFTFHYDGRHTLKGVLNGTPYPLIWLDVEPAKRIHVTEDVLSARPKPTPRQIHEFTTALITEFPNRFCSMLEFLDGPRPLAYSEFEGKITDSIRKLHQQFTDREENMAVKKRAVGMPEDGPRKNSADFNSLLSAALNKSKATTLVAGKQSSSSRNMGKRKKSNASLKSARKLSNEPVDKSEGMSSDTSAKSAPAKKAKKTPLPE